MIANNEFYIALELDSVNFDEDNADDINFDSEILDYDTIENYDSVQVDCLRLSPSGLLMDKVTGDNIGYTDGSGRYVFSRSEEAVYHRGLHARSLAFPQCKMMNSTVRDWEAEHPVFVGGSDSSLAEGVLSTGNSIADINNLRQIKSLTMGAHLSFDVWVVVAAVYGHVLAIWRKYGRRTSALSEWIYIPYSELFQTINPEYKWHGLSVATRVRWKTYFRQAFALLNDTSLEFDLPEDRFGNRRSEHRWDRLLESDEVLWGSNDLRQQRNSLRRWGVVREPVGVKVRIVGSELFNFLFVDDNRNPRLVQINNFDLCTRSVWGGRGGLCRSLHTVYMNWLVQYRNYFMKGKKRYASCEPIWSQSEMERAFAGGIFPIKKLSADEMLRMMNSIGLAERGKSRRPAHINDCRIVGRCRIEWTLIRAVKNADVFAKDSQGVNHSIDLSSCGRDIQLAARQLAKINRENGFHSVELWGKQIDTRMSAIFRREGDAVLTGSYGRNYSFCEGFQALKRKDRLKLKIDGSAICEVDYSGLHLNMLYAMNGSLPSGDVYDAGNWYVRHGLTAAEARDAVKKCVLMIVNASNKWRAFYAFRKNWNEETGVDKNTKIPWLFDLVEAVVNRHQPISQHFFSGMGVKLQWLDGIMMRNICHHFANRGICALPIHDSLVLPKRHEQDAVRVMQAEFARNFNGLVCPVKIK